MVGEERKLREATPPTLWSRSFQNRMRYQTPLTTDVKKPRLLTRLLKMVGEERKLREANPRPSGPALFKTGCATKLH